ncbi:MAG: hypothetical protein HKN40_12085, partial [Winogradskyella sp.]|uniref:hypothetical protein n=1 Tax=Winogradskyella sp. TaxID=1883156 RepID=UPI001807E432|nr:hypothetical protein [Winogradskyella sp.]
MKKHILVFIMLCIGVFSFGQDTYMVNGESLELKTEIEGPLSLLWNTINGEYRYFVRTSDGNFTELKNTRGNNNSYNEAYKSVLSKLTNGQSTNNLKLTLYDLRRFIDNYNKSVLSSYTTLPPDPKVGFNFALSGGFTNNPFISNPDNFKTPLIGAELEVFESRDLVRHSGFLQFRHTFDTDEFQYSASEFSLGYRYRFISKSSFALYGQVKFAALNFTNVTFTDANNMQQTLNDTSFDVPFIFGIGSDIRVGTTS